MDPISARPTSGCHVLATPYPGRGHINPMMNLCKLLVSRNDDIRVTFVVTEEWHGFIGSQPKPTNIRFACIPNVIPSEISRADDFPGFIEAVWTKMEAPYERLLDGLEPPPTLILADTFLAWAVTVGNRRNIPVASLWIMSATMFSILYHFDLILQNHHFPAVALSAEDGEERAEYIPGISSIRVVDLQHFIALDRARNAFKLLPKTRYLLFTSVQELEPHVLNALKSEFQFPVYPLGPSIPYFNLINQNPNNNDIFQWLDAQPRNSVLYVSFGSFLSVPEAQTNEIAAGLRDSGMRYLWVTRWETSKLKESCNSERGLAVAWCDQLKVLCHDSVGGFWTHCGWNSCLEGAYAGVPMLTYPIVADQPPNSKVIVEDWKVGARVRKVAVGMGATVSLDLVRRDEIAGIVKGFMDVGSEEGKEMRRRAEEVREICRGAISEGGSSETNMNSFIRDITKNH